MNSINNNTTISAVTWEQFDQLPSVESVLQTTQSTCFLIKLGNLGAIFSVVTVTTLLVPNFVRCLPQLCQEVLRQVVSGYTGKLALHSKSILCLKVSLTFSSRRLVTSHHHKNDKWSHEFFNWPQKVKVVKPSAPL